MTPSAIGLGRHFFVLATNLNIIAKYKGIIMSMPTFDGAMLPILKILNDEKVHLISEIVGFIEKEFNLTDEERQQRVPSGKMRTIYNRIAWAILYLKRANLIKPSKDRGSYEITSEGKRFLQSNPLTLDVKTLSTLKQNNKALTLLSTNDKNEPILSGFENTEKTPEETIGILCEQLNLELGKDLLDAIYNSSPNFFEGLVVDLLLKMGYGGSDGLGEVTNANNDSGIDGIIKQDILGFDTIYLQAKRWDRNSIVSRPEIQKFAGALLGKGASKGVFITTTAFSKGAIDYAQSVPNAKIVLIDGIKLCTLMIKYNLGVTICNTIYLKKIDSDYFEEQ